MEKTTSNTSNFKFEYALQKIERTTMHERSLLQIVYKEWKVWLPCSMVCFQIASLVLRGWPEGLFPFGASPFTYRGDSSFMLMIIERLADGWFLEESRSGYPFGSLLYDFPLPEFGNLLLLKIFRFVTGSAASAHNFFFLIGFALVFISAYCVLRGFGVSMILSVLGAMAYDFVPFHFLRIPHLIYTNYSLIPLFFWLGYKLFSYPPKYLNLRWIGRHFIYALPLSSFTVYYSAFGCIILGISALCGSIRTWRWQNLLAGFCLCIALCLGVTLNLLPNAIYHGTYGSNSSVTSRLPSEAELYGLKLIQMVLPSSAHRNEQLRNISQHYAKAFPLVTENHTASLGFLGTLGLALTAVTLLFAISGKNIRRRERFFSFQTLTLFIYGTIGGLGTFFSFFIHPGLRSINRVSTCIAFSVIALLFMATQRYVTKHNIRLHNYYIIVFFIFAIITYDQIPHFTAQNSQQWDSDKQFISSIENNLPSGAAVYQLPIMGFPEAGPIHKMYDYMPAVGFIHSKQLHWSYGAMKGRDGDHFFQSLADESVSKQVDVITRLGFSGIYIDRNGYVDNADTLIKELAALLGTSPIYSPMKEKLFFPLTTTRTAPSYEGKTPLQIMQQAGYVADKFGARYAASLADGIDFTRKDFPDFIEAMEGLSGVENWGRWSDATVRDKIRFSFNTPLPDRFILQIEANAFGPNAGQPIPVTIGTQTFNLTLGPNTSIVNIPVNLKGTNISTIELAPPLPTSPSQLNINTDTRKLGIGFVRIKLLPENATQPEQ